MAWLALAALLMLLAVPRGPGKPAPPDPTGLAAIAGFAAMAWAALFVYPPARVAVLASLWTAALLAILLVAPRRSAPSWLRGAMLAAAAAAALYALFGPPDGLF